MQTFKPNETDAAQLVKAAQLIKTGNKAQADGKKQTEAGKLALCDWLANERNCLLASLAVGEIVNIEGAALVEIGKQSRFDVGAFQLKHPELFAEFTKDFPVIKYKPLV